MVMTTTHPELSDLMADAGCRACSVQTEHNGLVAIGLNFRTAPVTLREKVAFNPQQVRQVLEQLAACPEIDEVFLLSTCNRTELYAVLRRGEDWPTLLCQALAAHCRATADELRESLYWYAGEDAARHLFRVTAGLESMILGEAEIVHQLKLAAGLAREAGTTGTILQRLIEKALSASKQARTQARYDECGLSVASVAITACKQAFPNLGDLSVLVLGAGETAELTLHYLVSKGVRRVLIANRTFVRAAQLAQLTGGEALPLAEIAARLHEADVVICCTASPQPLITPSMVMAAMRRRAESPVLIVDLAVPRDVDADVADIPHVELVNIDNLCSEAGDVATLRQDKLRCAEDVIESAVREFGRWLSSRRAVAAVAVLQEQIEALRQESAARLSDALHRSSADRHAALVEQGTQTLVRDILCASLAAMQQLIGADDASYQMEIARRVIDQTEGKDTCHAPHLL